MKLKAAFEEIEIVLNELNEQFETIKKNEARVPQIEIDIMMASMRKIYECMSQINKQKEFPRVEESFDFVPELDNNVLIESEAEEAIPEQTEAIIEETVLFKEDLTDNKVAANIVEEIANLEESIQIEMQKSIHIELEERIQSIEEKSLQKELKESMQSIEEEPKEHTLQAKAKSPRVEKPRTGLLLQFEDEIFSVNESVGQKSKDKSLVNKLSNTRIENLKSAIGINDKFYFINQLFGGNSQAYEDVIYALNNFKRFEEAMQYIGTLKYRYEWNTESEAFHKLIHFLERKFLELHA